MIFFQPGMTLPPPFNIIPSPKSIIRVLKWCAGRATCKGTHKCSAVRCCYNTTDDNEYDDDDATYELIMTRLVQRYLTSRRHTGGGGKGNSDADSLADLVREMRGNLHQVRHSLARVQRSLPAADTAPPAPGEEEDAPLTLQPSLSDEVFIRQSVISGSRPGDVGGRESFRQSVAGGHHEARESYGGHSVHDRHGSHGGRGGHDGFGGYNGPADVRDSELSM